MENMQPDPTSNEFMNNVTNLLVERKTLITPPFQNWLADFRRFIENIDQNCQPAEGSSIKESLDDFVKIEFNSYCCQTNGICGNQYYQHVKPIMDNTSTTVPIARIMFLHSPVRTQEDFIRNYDETHQIIASLQANLTAMAKDNPEYENQAMPTMYANSMFYVFFEQYTYIKGVAVQNLLVSLLLLFAIVAVGICDLVGLRIHDCHQLDCHHRVHDYEHDLGGVVR